MKVKKHMPKWAHHFFIYTLAGGSGNREDDVEEDAMTYEEEVREYNAGMEDDDEGIQAWSTVNLDKREEEEEEVSGSNLTISNLQFYMLMRSCGL